MPIRNRTIIVRLTTAEVYELTARATNEGMKLSPFVRRELLHSGKASADTALVLAELRRQRELMLRLAAAAGLDVTGIEDQVEGDRT
jgi:hypothetical protein